MFQTPFVELTELLSRFWFNISPMLSTLFGLILLDWILGMALALKQKRFQWQKVLQFWLTKISPILIGWLGFSLAVPMINVAFLPSDIASWLNGSLIYGSWIALVVLLCTQLWQKIKDLYGEALLQRVLKPDEVPSDGAEAEYIYTGTATLPDKDQN